MVSSTSMNTLNLAAKLLVVPSEELKMSLTTRMMSAGGSDMRSDTVAYCTLINFRLSSHS